MKKKETKPKAVKVMLDLVLLSIILGVFGVLLNLVQTNAQGTVLGYVVIGAIGSLIGTGVIVLFYVKLRQGRNWARLLFGILGFAWVFFGIVTISLSFSVDSGPFALSIGQKIISCANYVLTLVITMLAFHEPVRDWVLQKSNK